MMYKKEDILNGTQIKIIDNDNNNPIRYFYTENSKNFLEMYYFAWENNIPLDFKSDNDRVFDSYEDKIGIIEEIIIVPGGKYRFNVIEIYVEVRDFL